MTSITLKDGTEWPLNTAYNGDCLGFMQNLPDKCIDLVLTDPPYGIGANKMTLGNGKEKVFRGSDDWDANIPDRNVFEEIFRISKNQIIWGGNYFVEYLKPSMGWIFWDKGTGGNDFSDGELAYTSFDQALKKYFVSWVGQNAKEKNQERRIHPTQKSLKLFKWCLEKYAPDNAIIFDPFLGSFTTALACHNYGLNWLGCEKDEDYFKAGLNRYNLAKQQILMEFDQ